MSRTARSRLFASGFFVCHFGAEVPYRIEEDGGEFWVVNSQTGKRKNKKPYNSRRRALAYLQALEANMPKSEKKLNITIDGVPMSRWIEKHYDAKHGGI